MGREWNWRIFGMQQGGGKEPRAKGHRVDSGNGKKKEEAEGGKDNRELGTEKTLVRHNDIFIE